MKKITSFVFILLASYFCLGDVVAFVFKTNEACHIVDLGEEGAEESDKDDKDDKNEWKMHSSHLMALSHFKLDIPHNPLSDKWAYITPYFEIISPPPELV